MLIYMSNIFSFFKLEYDEYHIMLKFIQLNLHIIYKYKQLWQL
jgi:hypothetical protein